MALSASARCLVSARARVDDDAEQAACARASLFFDAFAAWDNFPGNSCRRTCDVEQLASGGLHRHGQRTPICSAPAPRRAAGIATATSCGRRRGPDSWQSNATMARRAPAQRPRESAGCRLRDFGRHKNRPPRGHALQRGRAERFRDHARAAPECNRIARSCPCGSSSCR